MQEIPEKAIELMHDLAIEYNTSISEISELVSKQILEILNILDTNLDKDANDLSVR